MKTMLLSALILGAGLLLPGAEWKATRQEPESDYSTRVVPQLQRVDFKNTTCTVGPGTLIRSGADSSVAAGLLARQLERNGLPGKRGSVGEIVLETVPEEGRPEGYRLEITPERIRITGNSSRGLLYGVQTLRQLLRPTDDGVSELPLGTAEDFPDLAWRGVFTSGLASDRAYRENFPETLSLLKLNFAIIRVDQWLKYERLPGLAHKRASYSKEEYRAVVRKGRELGLEMIPNTSLYSHFAWALWGEYGFLMDVPQKAISGFSTPDIDNPAAQKLIRGIMREVYEAFDSPRYYHVGQDELKYAPRLPAGQEKRPFRDKFATALKLLHDTCRELDVKMMMWGDQMARSRSGGAPDDTYLLRKDLPRDVILADFTYFGSNFKSVQELAGDGFPVLGTCWYDVGCISRYCEVLQDTPGVLGLLISMWGGMKDYYTVPEHQVALVWGAENSWSVGKPRYEEYRNFPADTFYFLSTIQRPLVRSYRALDLGSEAKTPLDGADSMFGRGEALDFSAVPEQIGRRDFTFELAGRKCLVLDGEAKEAVIRFQPEKADSIAFAHTTDLPVRRALAFTNLDNKGFYDPKVIAVYKVAYEDGSSVDIPINYTREITDWNEPAGAAAAPVVWNGKTPNGKLARIFAFRWLNPHPDKKIVSITLSAGKSPLSLALFGISLERN